MKSVFAHENSKISEMDIQLMKVLLWTRTGMTQLAVAKSAIP